MYELSLRDRLILTAATLTRWGVEVRPALPLDGHTGRAALGTELAGRSWVFWTRRDDRAFDRAGGLGADLTLHSGDSAAAAAVRAAGRTWGLDDLREGHDGSLVLPANARARHHGRPRHPVTGRASSDLARHGG
jgi:hypothetical protein